ncbi:hypothetical protein HK405_009611, partial [Cladochytrium tenue]
MPRSASAAVAVVAAAAADPLASSRALDEPFIADAVWASANLDALTTATPVAVADCTDNGVSVSDKIRRSARWTVLVEPRGAPTSAPAPAVELTAKVGPDGGGGATRLRGVEVISGSRRQEVYVRLWRRRGGGGNDDEFEYVGTTEPRGGGGDGDVEAIGCGASILAVDDDRPVSE